MRIANAKVVTESAVLADGLVDIEAGRITAAETRPPGAVGAGELDANGDWLLPGFIDMHVHGCLGQDLMDLDAGHWERASLYLARHGVTSFLATSTAAAAGAIDSFLAMARAQVKAGLPGATLIGVHLEGPYLNTAWAGMHPPRWCRAPDPKEYHRWLASEIVRRFTVSLELPGAEELLGDCRAAGALLSLGHTGVSAEEARCWADRGLRHVTHLYNAMSRAEKRGPTRWCGCVEGTLADSRLSAEVIADGHHVPEALFRIAARCKGPAGLTMASDGTPFTGTAREGETVRYGGSDGLEAQIRNGLALSLDGTSLVGSIAPLGDMLPRVLAWLDRDWIAVGRAFSTTAADLLGLGDHKGRIAPGRDADLVLADTDGRIRRVWVGGREIAVGT